MQAIARGYDSSQRKFENPAILAGIEDLKT
jgi:hypothetical protein